MNTIYTDKLERYESAAHKTHMISAGPYDGNLYDDELALRTKLLKFGLSAADMETVIDRVVKNKTFREIARDRGYSAAQPAIIAYQRAIRHLKEKGYK